MIFQDCHGTGGDKTIPVQDDTQNVLAEEGYQNGTHTQIIFRRPLETCDPHDVTITVSLIQSRQTNRLTLASEYRQRLIYKFVI